MPNCGELVVVDIPEAIQEHEGIKEICVLSSDR